jgi:hypothetical protein
MEQSSVSLSLVLQCLKSLAWLFRQPVRDIPFLGIIFMYDGYDLFHFKENQL